MHVRALALTPSCVSLSDRLIFPVTPRGQCNLSFLVLPYWRTAFLQIPYGPGDQGLEC